MSDFSEFVVYADESGDHGLVAIDPQYPVFALVFCAMRKTDYIAGIVPGVQSFKFGVWGHDAVVLHEHDIRKSKGPFAVLLTDRELRERFYEGLNRLVEAAPMKIFAAVIDKSGLRARYADTRNPYRVALRFCMEQLHAMLSGEDSPPFVKRVLARASMRAGHLAWLVRHAAWACLARAGLKTVWFSSIAQATPSRRSATPRSARA